MEAEPYTMGNRKNVTPPAAATTPKHHRGMPVTTNPNIPQRVRYTPALPARMARNPEPWTRLCREMFWKRVLTEEEFTMGTLVRRCEQ
jgi:hypothetical protein